MACMHLSTFIIAYWVSYSTMHEPLLAPLHIHNYAWFLHCVQGYNKACLHIAQPHLCKDLIVLCARLQEVLLIPCTPCKFTIVQRFCVGLQEGLLIGQFSSCLYTNLWPLLYHSCLSQFHHT